MKALWSSLAMNMSDIKIVVSTNSSLRSLISSSFSSRSIKKSIRLESHSQTPFGCCACICEQPSETLQYHDLLLPDVVENA